MIHARAVLFGAVFAVFASGLGGCAGSSSVPPRIDAVVAYPWTAKAPLQLARTDAAVAVVNNRIYAIGGIGTVPVNGGRYANTVEAYDPSADRWTTAAPVRTQEWGRGAAAISNVLYTVGGEDYCCDQTDWVESFDTSSNTWTTRSAMTTFRASLGVAVINNLVYAVGGRQQVVLPYYSVPVTIDSSVLEAYDPSADRWTFKAPMPTARQGVSVGVINNVLYVAGGSQTVSGTTHALGTVEAYDPATNTWTTKATMPTARDGAAAGVVNNILYVVGGQGDGIRNYYNTVEAYDPATNTWTTKPPMLTRRTRLAAAVVDNVLYAIGGDTGSAPLATVETYKP